MTRHAQRAYYVVIPVYGETGAYLFAEGKDLRHALSNQLGSGYGEPYVTTRRPKNG